MPFILWIVFVFTFVYVYQQWPLIFCIYASYPFQLHKQFITFVSCKIYYLEKFAYLFSCLLSRTHSLFWGRVFMNQILFVLILTIFFHTFSRGVGADKCARREKGVYASGLTTPSFIHRKYNLLFSTKKKTLRPNIFNINNSTERRFSTQKHINNNLFSSILFCPIWL